MGEMIRNFLKPEEKKKLKEIGRKGDVWSSLLREAGDDEDMAQFLADVRGDKVLEF